VASTSTSVKGLDVKARNQGPSGGRVAKDPRDESCQGGSPDGIPPDIRPPLLTPLPPTERVR